MTLHRILALVLGGLLVFLSAAPVVAMAKDSGKPYTPEELAQMLAPIALYPDALLSQLLLATTYPGQIVAADRWVINHPLLRGDNLDRALRKQNWDASVKGLCHVPALLGLMKERLEDTTRIGDAFLTQEKEVMDTVQDLRAKARREGNLKSDDRQLVTVAEDGTIIIEPVDPKTLHVPYYNTRNVYGTWRYPAWPPWYWGPDELNLGSGIYFWPDFYFGFGQLSHFDWRGRTIIIDANQHRNLSRTDHEWNSADKKETGSPEPGRSTHPGGGMTGPSAVDSPQVESARPGQGNHGRDNETRREPTRTRVLSTDDDDGIDLDDGRIDRPGSSGRESRQLGTQDRLDRGTDDGDWFGRGGRR